MASRQDDTLQHNKTLQEEVHLMEQKLSEQSVTLRKLREEGIVKDARISEATEDAEQLREAAIVAGTSSCQLLIISNSYLLLMKFAELSRKKLLTQVEELEAKYRQQVDVNVELEGVVEARYVL
jgi:hypothetical protein